MHLSDQGRKLFRSASSDIRESFVLSRASSVGLEQCVNNLLSDLPAESPVVETDAIMDIDEWLGDPHGFEDYEIFNENEKSKKELANGLRQRWSKLCDCLEKVLESTSVAQAFNHITRFHMILNTIPGMRSWLRTYLFAVSKSRGESVSAKLLIDDLKDLESGETDPDAHALWVSLKKLVEQPSHLAETFDLSELKQCIRDCLLQGVRHLSALNASELRTALIQSLERQLKRTLAVPRLLHCVRAHFAVKLHNFQSQQLGVGQRASDLAEWGTRNFDQFVPDQRWVDNELEEVLQATSLEVHAGMTGRKTGGGVRKHATSPPLARRTRTRQHDAGAVTDAASRARLVAGLKPIWSALFKAVYAVTTCGSVPEAFEQITRAHELMVRVPGLRNWARRFIASRSSSRGESNTAKLLLADHCDLDNPAGPDLALHEMWLRFKEVARSPSLLGSMFTLDALRECFRSIVVFDDGTDTRAFTAADIEARGVAVCERVFMRQLQVPNLVQVIRAHFAVKMQAKMDSLAAAAHAMRVSGGHGGGGMGTLALPEEKQEKMMDMLMQTIVDTPRSADDRARQLKPMEGMKSADELPRLSTDKLGGVDDLDLLIELSRDSSLRDNSLRDSSLRDSSLRESSLSVGGLGRISIDRMSVDNLLEGLDLKPQQFKPQQQQFKPPLPRGPPDAVHAMAPAPAPPQQPAFKSGRPGAWTREEDALLRHAVESFVAANGVDAPLRWKEIEKQVPNRAPVQCRQRWLSVLNTRVVKGVWTASEDALLLQAMAAAGADKGGVLVNWNAIVESIPQRNRNQVKDRWENHLDPTLHKGPWTADEVALLVSLQASMGNKFAQIARQIPGRSLSQVKIRWRSLQRAVK